LYNAEVVRKEMGEPFVTVMLADEAEETQAAPQFAEL